MVDFTAKTVWNMDESRMKAVDYYMCQAEACFVSWDLESLYVHLAQVRRLISGKISVDQYNHAGSLLKDIERLRQSINIHDEEATKRAKVEIYNKSDELYVYLNRMMKKHGMFFKEGDDPTRAALKR